MTGSASPGADFGTDFSQVPVHTSGATRFIPPAQARARAVDGLRWVPGLLRPSQVPVPGAATWPTGFPFPAGERTTTSLARSPSPAGRRAHHRPDLASSVALQRQEHVHNASCGHPGPAPAQRSTVHSVLRSPGEPFDGPLRQEMETRLGADFNGVRLHTGPTAQRSAAEIGARAYTSGNHVVVGESGADKKTIAHELYHVIQQSKGPVAGTPTADGLSVSDPSDRHEQEATRKTAGAMAAPLPVQGAPAERTGADGGRPRQAPGAVQSVQRAPGMEDLRQRLQRIKRIAARVLFKPSPDVLYRLDNREPAVIAQGGFGPWLLEGNLTVEEHVTRRRPRSESQWVSTGALRMLEDPTLLMVAPGKYLYRIDPEVAGGSFVDVNDRLDRDGVSRSQLSYFKQREYAVGGRAIPPHAITGYLGFDTEVMRQLVGIDDPTKVTVPAGGLKGWHVLWPAARQAAAPQPAAP